MRRVLTIIALVLLTATGCGLQADSAPREVALNDLPTQLRPGQLPTPTPVIDSASASLSNDQIFMLGPDNRLTPVARETASTPDQVLGSLLNGTSPQEASADITSAISLRNTGIRVLAIDPLFELVTVDLAPDSLDPRSSEQKLAYAQIVYSLTSLEGITRVEFVRTDPETPDADPEGLAVLTDTGRTVPGTLVGRSDYAQLDPNAGPRPEPEFEEFPTPEPTVDTTVRFPVTVWKVRQIFQGDDGVEVVGEAAALQGTATTTEWRIIGVVRQLEQVDPEAVLTSLFGGTPEGERNLGLRSAFPPDAFVNAVTVTSYDAARPNSSGVLAVGEVRIAQVDLSAGSLPVATDGNERLLAAAQVVFTLTGLPDIDEVVFSIDGEQIEIPTDNGPSSTFDPENPVGLTRIDFALEAPGGYLWLPQPPITMTPTPVPEPTPTPTS